MSIVAHIKQIAAAAINQLYTIDLAEQAILVNTTKPEFEGDYTIVLFAFVKQLKKQPDALGNELGAYIVAQHSDTFSGYNVIKGFLNLTVSESYWVGFLAAQYNNPHYGLAPANGERVMVEYSSPNTNKPLHLGHLRNNFLGWSTAQILKANGFDVVKTCVVNDRGVHICKSMYAWQQFANGATPENTHMKGDHLVGDYYVKFETEIKKEAATLASKIEQDDYSDFSETDKQKLLVLKATIASVLNEPEKLAKVKAEINDLLRANTESMKAVRQMLLDWEAGKPDVIELWKTMNGWVYEGFEETYKKIGSDFDKIYYESNTYLLGKDLVEEGLQKNVFYKKEDGSVWVDLTNDGLDEKVVQRKDGTSVYITQDIGLAEQKQKEYQMQQSIYVVGDEQNYHFKVLKLICQKLSLPSAEGIHHLSYGMVELPSGKMKSREGTVVDADDIVEEMVAIAQQKTEELGKVKDFEANELQTLYHTIGLGALKFFILRVDPKKRMVFNPEESIDFHGFTAPFIQFTYARIKSILRKENAIASAINTASSTLLPLEKEIIVLTEQYYDIVKEAGDQHDPSKVAIYVYSVAKTFSSFYTEHSIANAESEEKKQLRLQLCRLTAQVIKSAMNLLGIDVPERM